MIAQAPCVQQPINGPLTHHSRSPVQRLPAPLPLNTPKPEKSQIRLDHPRLVPGIELSREGRSKGATGVSGLAVAHDMRADREALIPADVAPENIELVVQRVEVANGCGFERYTPDLHDLQQRPVSERNNAVRHMAGVGDEEVGLVLTSPQLCRASQG